MTAITHEETMWAFNRVLNYCRFLFDSVVPVQHIAVCTRANTKTRSRFRSELFCRYTHKTGTSVLFKIHCKLQRPCSRAIVPEIEVAYLCKNSGSHKSWPMLSSEKNGTRGHDFCGPLFTKKHSSGINSQRLHNTRSERIQSNLITLRRSIKTEMMNIKVV